MSVFQLRDAQIALSILTIFLFVFGLMFMTVPACWGPSCFSDSSSELIIWGSDLEGRRIWYKDMVESGSGEPFAYLPAESVVDMYDVQCVGTGFVAPSIPSCPNEARVGQKFDLFLFPTDELGTHQSGRVEISYKTGSGIDENVAIYCSGDLVVSETVSILDVCGSYLPLNWPLQAVFVIPLIALIAVSIKARKQKKQSQKAPPKP